MPVKLIAPVEDPLQTTISTGSFTLGVGLTVIVKDCVEPVHDPYRGVTVMVATTGIEPLFKPVNAAMSPVPLPARPIDVLSFTQLKPVVPVPENVTAVVNDPLHTTWFAGSNTLGVGLTIMVKVCTDPLHVTAPNVYFGVTVMVATTGADPAFTPLKAAMFPVPPAPSPIEGVSLLQS